MEIQSNINTDDFLSIASDLQINEKKSTQVSEFEIAIPWKQMQNDPNVC